MKELIITLALIGTAACSKNDGLAPNNDRFGCPSSVHIPYHRVKIEAYETVPQKIAIELEGEVKYDECLEQAVIPPPPIVTVERNDFWLSFTVEHFGAYEELPQSISFRVFDRKYCTESELYFSVNEAHLEFHKYYPNGFSCGSNTFAEIIFPKH